MRRIGAGCGTPMPGTCQRTIWGSELMARKKKVKRATPADEQTMAVKRQERQLQESYDYAVSIVETVREPLIVLDDSLRVETANRSFYQTFHVTPAETEGRLIYDLGKGQWDIPRLRTLLEEIVPQKSHFENFEVEHDFPKIGRRSMLLNAHRVVHRAGKPGELILLAIEDITDRKQAEEALREREMRLRRMMENAHVGIAFGDSQGRIVEANRTMMELVGWSEDDLRAGRLNCGALCRPEDHEQDLWAMTQLATVGRVGPAEKILIRSDGEQIPVLISAFRLDANHDENVTFVVDLLSQKQTEEALRDREARLRTILSTAADAVITIDESGTIDSVNLAAERMFGYTAAEMMGRNVTMLMASPYREEHDGYLARYLKTGEKRIIGIGREVQGRGKDGLTFPLDLGVSEFDAQGRRLFTGVLRDISARKQLEREVLEVATLEQRRIGQALHDSTGQELLALGLLAESLSETVKDQFPAMLPLVEKIGDGLQRALAQIRDYSRGLIPVEVDARGLQVALAQLAERVSALHGVECTLECKEPLEVPDNHAATHLYHIAQEAVTNALRHAHPKRVTIHLESCAKFITLRVTDDGLGLPAEPLDSKGMGLKIMRYRAGLINGRLSVEPAGSGGTQVSCVIAKGTHGQEQEIQK
jgi:PAS domain S-box-containing protein